jgi:hypothetical protein
MLTRALFGLEPDIPGRRLQVDPVLPEASTLLRIEDMPLACTPITIETATRSLFEVAFPPASPSSVLSADAVTRRRAMVAGRDGADASELLDNAVGEVAGPIAVHLTTR